MRERTILSWPFAIKVGAAWTLLTMALFMVAPHMQSLGQVFMRWDAGWYITIARHGYALASTHKQANFVFFPLYPLVVRWAQFVIGGPAWAVGVGVSVTCFVLALTLFYDFVRLRYDNKTARIATILLAFNPFALFFVLVYTESLFLLVSIAVFWCLDRRWFWWAATCAGLACATRATGMILALIVLAQWVWRQRQGWSSPWFAAQFGTLTLIALSGFVAFAVYLQVHNHDALIFVHGERYWGRTGPAHIISEFQTNYHQLRYNLVHYHPKYWFNRLNAFVVWYMATITGLVGLWLLLRQREYWLSAYVAGGITLPLLSGTFVSMNRYVMVLFPIYIALARILKGRGRWLVVGASSLLWAGFWLLYLSGQMFFG